MIKIKFKKERKLNRSIIRKSGAIGSLLYLSRNVESVRKQMLQIAVRSSTFKKYTQNTTHRCYLKYKSMMKNGLMMFVMICWHKSRTFTTKSDNQKQKGMLKWNIKLVWNQRDLGKLLQDQDRAQVQDHQDHQRVIKPWKILLHKIWGYGKETICRIYSAEIEDSRAICSTSSLSRLRARLQYVKSNAKMEILEEEANETKIEELHLRKYSVCNCTISTFINSKGSS